MNGTQNMRTGYAKSIVSPSVIKSDRALATTVMDTIVVTEESIKTWKVPPFQRPLRINAKVYSIRDEIISTGVIPGVITLGRLDGVLYRLDGQHRLESFLLSGLLEGYVDVRIIQFNTMAEMGLEFIRLNSSISPFTPNDILRSMESSCAPMAYIRKCCPFVGYSNIRRGVGNAIVSMSALIRCWRMSSSETPISRRESAVKSATDLSMQDAKELVEFLQIADSAWGRDREYQRLWGGLNLTMCLWLFRRTVLHPPTEKAKRVKAISRELFKNCLMSLSASSSYLDWLVGRQMSERDRSPAYSRIKAIFVCRILEETGTRTVLPAPEWASNSAGTGSKSNVAVL